MLKKELKQINKDLHLTTRYNKKYNTLIDLISKYKHDLLEIKDFPKLFYQKIMNARFINLDGNVFSLLVETNDFYYHFNYQC